MTNTPFEQSVKAHQKLRCLFSTHYRIEESRNLFSKLLIQNDELFVHDLSFDLKNDNT